MKFDIGKWKVIFDRAKGYVAWVQFLMVAYLFIGKTGLLWWFLPLIVLFIGLMWVDTKYVFPKEINYRHSQSKYLRNLNNDS